MDFNVKKVLCEPHTIHASKEHMESLWIFAFLRRVGVPEIMIKKCQSGEIGSKNWREYLAKEFYLDISKNLYTKQVQVLKVVKENEPPIVVGQWSEPKVVRQVKQVKRKESKVSAGQMQVQGTVQQCELQLVYWQLL